jgi:hypothetical protein
MSGSALRAMPLFRGDDMAMSLSDKEKKKLVGLSPKARAALVSKFIDDKVRARCARLTPALAALGSRDVRMRQVR